MASALEAGVQPERHDFVGEAGRHDATAYGEHVGVIVQARHSRGVELVAQCGADPRHLVRGHLLALAASADDDPAIGGLARHQPADVGADVRIVHRRFAVRPAIVDVVTEALQGCDEVLLEREASVIGADRDAHGGNYNLSGVTWDVLPRATCLRATCDVLLVTCYVRTCCLSRATCHNTGHGGHVANGDDYSARRRPDPKRTSLDLSQ